jgi:hypothetical protein
MNAIDVQAVVTPLTLSCCACGRNKILAPPESIPETKFTCRDCVAQISHDRSVAEGLAFGASQRAAHEYARRRLAALRTSVAVGVPKTNLLDNGQTFNRPETKQMTSEA